MTFARVSAETASNPYFWGTLMLIGIITAIKPAWGCVLNRWGRDEDGEPTDFAIAVARGVGVLMAVVGGIYFLGYLNT